MNILITGGAGFIGSHLADRLVKENHNVIIYDNLDSQVHLTGDWPDYLSSSVEKVYGDVQDKKFLQQVIQDYNIESVYHLAAKVGVGQSMYEIQSYVDVNVGGTSNLLDIVVNKKTNIKKIIVASSMSCYGEGSYKNRSLNVRSTDQLKQQIWDLGDTPIPTDESKILESQSIYALTKKMQEEMCLSIGRAYNIPTVALRFFNIYGTRQSLNNPYTGVVAIFCSCFLNNQAPIIFEDGNQLRDFVHIDDIVEACYLSLVKTQADYDVFNVASGMPITIHDLAKVIQKLMGSDQDPIISNKFRVGDVRHCFADITKIQQYLGYKPKQKLEKGLKELINWVINQSSEIKVGDMLDKLSDKKLII
jgi:dTDP-L-rhamnose 4-epimerase